MSKLKISQLLLTISILASLAGCIKDDTSEKQENEKRLIANYVATHNITAPATASGLYISHTQIGTGFSPVGDDMVLINYRIKDLNGKLAVANDSAFAGNATGYFLSQIVGGPFKLVLSTANLGLREGLAAMREGGKATLVVPSILWWGDYNPVVIDVELIKIIKEPIVFENEQIGFFLDSICKAKNKTVLTNADSTKKGVTGVYYIEMVKGTGDSIVDGKTVTVEYQGNLISYKNICKERKFDKGTNFEFKLFNPDPNKRNIPGFDEGIRHMRKGGEGIVVIPYHRGYGFNGYINYQYYNQVIIPAYSTLVFYLKIKEVK